MRIVKFFRYIPGVKMMAVCNSLSYNRALQESDIDFFVITGQNRIWTVRFFCILFLKIFGLRPKLKYYQHYQNDRVNNFSNRKICMCFFVTEENLNLEKYKICVHDYYLAFWINNIKVIYDEGDMYTKFIQANQWVFQDQNYSKHINSIQRLYAPNYKRRVSRSLFKPMINFLVTDLDEKIYKFIQLKMMPSIIKKMACDWDSRVIISDQVLKFHTNDRRLEYKRLFNKSLSTTIPAF